MPSIWTIIICAGLCYVGFGLIVITFCRAAKQGDEQQAKVRERRE